MAIVIKTKTVNNLRITLTENPNTYVLDVYDLRENRLIYTAMMTKDYHTEKQAISEFESNALYYRYLEH